MKIKLLLSAIALLAINKSVRAQSSSANSADSVRHFITQPFYIINQLEPIALGPAGQKSSKEAFGFNISKVKQLLPALIRDETTWIQKGKNYYTTVNRETIDFVQLVPLLVAALQQQQAELAELKLKMEKLQMQLNNNRSRN